jgi:excisionase family DNA binding protein
VKEYLIMPTVPHDPTIPTAEEAILAREVSRALERQPGELSLSLLVTAPEHETTTLQLPRGAANLLTEILKQMAEGNAVSLMPAEPEITTQQAANLLCVSRPYLVGMIEKGELPVRMVGNQRRLPLKDVLAYRLANQAKHRAALDEMSALHQEMGLE